MGANRQQGWSLLLFVVGFTFLVAGFFALGIIFSIFGLACLIAAAIWCYRIKPLEHLGSENMSQDLGAPPETPRVASAAGRR
jgi:membrane-bound ClpP family serine protease